jgi:pimeloyl-ACP methyl ester carboxylesterase
MLTHFGSGIAKFKALSICAVAWLRFPPQRLLSLAEMTSSLVALCAEEVLEGIADATCAIVPQSGHMMSLEARDRFRREVGNFLFGSDGGRSATL